jgi:hypothetical protein
MAKCVVPLVLTADKLMVSQDFWSVYSEKLGFLKSVSEKDIFVRTSVETRTMQVASGLLVGFDPSFATKTFPVTTQPSPVRRTITFSTAAMLTADHVDRLHPAQLPVQQSERYP